MWCLHALCRQVHCTARSLGQDWPTRAHAVSFDTGEVSIVQGIKPALAAALNKFTPYICLEVALLHNRASLSKHHPKIFCRPLMTHCSMPLMPMSCCRTRLQESKKAEKSHSHCLAGRRSPRIAGRRTLRTAAWPPGWVRISAFEPVPCSDFGGTAFSV